MALEFSLQRHGRTQDILQLIESFYLSFYIHYFILYTQAQFTHYHRDMQFMVKRNAYNEPENLRNAKQRGIFRRVVASLRFNTVYYLWINTRRPCIMHKVYVCTYSCTQLLRCYNQLISGRKIFYRYTCF